MRDLDKALEEALNGTFDIEKAQKELNYRAALYRYIFTRLKREPKKIREQAKKLLDAADGNLTWIRDVAFLAVSRVSGDPKEPKDPDLAYAALKKAEQMASAEQKPLVQAWRGYVLFQLGQKEEGRQLVQKALQQTQDPKLRKEIQSYLNKTARSKSTTSAKKSSS